MQIYLRELQEKRSVSERSSEKENWDESNSNDMRAVRDTRGEEDCESEERRLDLKIACGHGNAFKKVVSSRVKLNEAK